MNLIPSVGIEDTDSRFDVQGVNNQDENNEPSCIADTVRAFYDRHPYPPPVTDLDQYGRRWEDPYRRRADYHLNWPDQPYREGLRILVAGCGTSQAARHAIRNPENHVTGIDVSSTSIQYTEELRRRYQLSNLVVHQLPIERAHELDQRFDLIVCTGVLHHLPDPDAGLCALQHVLKTDGAMHLMVYATYGRTGIYMLQEYCRRLGIGRSDKEVLDLAHTLLALPQGHPLAQLLAETQDFKTKTGLADALLHPQDRPYTVPQFLDLIDRAGLTFGRWVRQAPYLPQCGASAQTPHGDRLSMLSQLEQYALAELFRGTMVRHSAIVYRNDRAGDDQAIRFDGEPWQYYVPMRLLETLCIRENLPAGAAAVLLNQSHTYTDLILPINEEQLKLFEAIDGERTIAEILSNTVNRGEQYDEYARSFFEQLWLYDQVVFDASRHEGHTDAGDH